MKALKYTSDKESEIMALEELITQGKSVVLKINKSHFLQRAAVFKTFTLIILNKTTMWWELELYQRLQLH